MFPRYCLLAGCLFFVAQAGSPSVSGQDKEPAAPEKRVVVGRLFSAVGTLLTRPDSTKDWRLPALYDSVSSKDELLVLPGARGVLELKEGEVRLSLVGDLPGLSPSLILETAAVLHAGGAFDLDMTLQRGRAMVENRRKKGDVKVRFRVGQDHLDVELAGRDTMAVLELYRRWLPGTPFVKDAKKPPQPESNLLLLITKGKASVEFRGEKQTLEGPVLYHWSNYRRFEGPVRLKALPKWITPAADNSPRATAWHNAVESLRRVLADKGLEAGLADALKQADSLKRSVAVYASAALDDLKGSLAGLEDSRSAEVRAAGVEALQHFAGRGHEFARQLYQALVHSKFTAGQAEIAIQLLRGFGAEELARPETYDALITYLKHQRLAVRELAAWNLYRLVPQGKDIAYDAAAPAEQRSRAQAAWRKLIPEGQLPPSPKKD
jgi:hypothetical protein